MLKILAGVVPLLVLSLPAIAHENYEIQVYPAETVKAGSGMIELHSNLTVEGGKTEEDGVLPTVGVGATHSTDHLLIKMIMGYRFGKKV